MYTDRCFFSSAPTLVSAFRLLEPGFSEKSVAAAVKRATAWSAHAGTLRPDYSLKRKGVPGKVMQVRLTLETGWDMTALVNDRKMLSTVGRSAIRALAKASQMWSWRSNPAGWAANATVGTDVEFATTVGFVSSLAEFLTGDASLLVFTQQKVTLSQPVEQIIATMIEHDGADVAFPYASWVGRWSGSNALQPVPVGPPSFANAPVGDGRGKRVVFTVHQLATKNTEKHLPQFGCGAVVLTRKAATYALLLRHIFENRADDENLMQALVQMATWDDAMRVSVALPTETSTGWLGQPGLKIVSKTNFATYDYGAASTH